MKLGGTELKLAEAKSLNLAQADEIANLKVTLEAYENKWYNEGFVDAKNSMEPVISQAQRLAFGEGWLAPLQAVGVPEDSPLRNPNQIPFPDPARPVQNLPNVDEEEETASIRELVQEIDPHMELVDLEVTSSLRASDHPESAQTIAQPSEGITGQHIGDAAFLPSTNLAV